MIAGLEFIAQFFITLVLGLSVGYLAAVCFGRLKLPKRKKNGRRRWERS